MKLRRVPALLTGHLSARSITHMLAMISPAYLQRPESANGGALFAQLLVGFPIGVPRMTHLKCFLIEQDPYNAMMHSLLMPRRMAKVMDARRRSGECSATALTDARIALNARSCHVQDYVVSLESSVTANGAGDGYKVYTVPSILICAPHHHSLIR